MNSADDLLDEWTDDESGLPAWRVQQLRDDLRAQGLDVPRGRRQISEWVESQEDEITETLRDAADDVESDPDSDAESDSDTEGEPEDVSVAPLDEPEEPVLDSDESDE